MDYGELFSGLVFVNSSQNWQGSVALIATAGTKTFLKIVKSTISENFVKAQSN